MTNASYAYLFILQSGDIESDAPLTKRLRRSSSDALQDMVSGEELSFYGSGPHNAQLAQVRAEPTSMLSYLEFYDGNLYLEKWCLMKVALVLSFRSAHYPDTLRRAGGTSGRLLRTCS